MQRRKQPVSPSHSAIRRRSSDAEATEPGRINVRGLAPLLVGGVAGAAGPAVQLQRPADAASIVALQRTHGNAYVGGLIARSGAAAVVQRGPAPVLTDYPNDTAIGTEPLKAIGRTLYALHGTGAAGIFNISLVNRDAGRVLQGFAALQQDEQKTQLALNVVKAHRGGGASALKAVDDAKATIGARARKEKGQYSRGAIQDYLGAVSGAKDNLEEVKKAQGAVKVALLEMKTVFVRQERMKQQDVVEEVTKRRDFEQEHVDNQKELINFTFENGRNLLDPTKWKGMAVDAAWYLGRKFVHATIDTAELEKVQEELTAAKAKLRKIDDQVILSELDAKREILKQAMDAVQSAERKFTESLKHLQRMEVSVTESLSTSKDTKGAAAAITERGNVATAAVLAERGLNGYIADSTTYLNWIKKLDGLYQRLLVLVEKEPKRIALNDAQAEHFDAVARANRATLDQLDTWVVLARQDAQDKLAMHAKVNHMAGYEQITDVLHSALAGRNYPQPKSTPKPKSKK
jgi:hypothetical protein